MTVNQNAESVANAHQLSGVCVSTHVKGTVQIGQQLRDQETTCRRFLRASVSIHRIIAAEVTRRMIRQHRTLTKGNCRYCTAGVMV